MFMPQGRVKVFDTERRFGFLQPSEGGRDVFVHASEVEGEDELRPGDVVEYEEGEGDEGPAAQSVTVIERAPEDVPTGRVVAGGGPPTWDELERLHRDQRSDRRQRRRRR
jgi:cold shock CspA family protein